MQRFIITTLLFTSLFSSLQALASERSVVFIHGRGPAELSDITHATRFWRDLARTATHDFSLPTLIVHYDATKNLSETSVQVAKQITDFIQQHAIPENTMTIVAHSYGGVISRFVLSNRDLNTDFAQTITATKQVITLGSPHHGSVAADLAVNWQSSGGLVKELLVSMFADINDSLLQLTTSEMTYQNQHCIIWGTANCPALPKPFYLISGGHKTDFWQTFYDTWETDDLLIAGLSPLIDDAGSHDGIVTQRSSEGLKHNATLYHRTARNHNHLRSNAYNPHQEKTMAELLRKLIFN